jgi:hypothetical protein
MRSDEKRRDLDLSEGIWVFLLKERKRKKIKEKNKKKTEEKKEVQRRF